MIFATDLDGTIIFGKRFIEEGKDFICIEKKEEEEISYITKKSKTILNQLNRGCLVIPTTTRTIEQYERINLFKNEKTPKYAITSNGGNILVNGEVDIHWNSEMNKKIDEMDIDIRSIKEEFFKVTGEEWVLLYRFSDELFWTFIVDLKKTPEKKLEEFKEWADKNGFMMSFQGRKVYVIPKFISKWNALKYILEKNKSKTFVSAGDTNLDKEMILKADIKYVPSHAEIKFEDNNGVNYTKQSGLLAGEEILKSVYEKIKHSSVIHK